MRFPLSVGGVPVLGGEVVVDVAADGDPRGALSETLPGAGPSTTTPTVAVASAARAAKAATARSAGTVAASLSVGGPVLSIYDPRILGGPGLARATLVWRLEVTSVSRPDIRRLVLVDARSGAVVLNIDQVAEGLSRTVCDAQNSDSQVPCVTPVRAEGGAATGTADVDLAYDFAGKTYDFYLSRFARDSLDGAGLPLRSTVRYCDPLEPCPLQNAFWNGQQMVYGQGYASADDVVAHELTHGVTEFSSHLFYYYQSGAINESLSDIFGEIVDQTDGVDGAGGPVRWQMGEDLPIGAIRSMADPPAHGDPDRTGSPLYFGGSDDNGGVHINSGVGNKFAYLLADGSTFNGRTVLGLGVEKAARIIFNPSQLMTSAADYRVFAATLRQSCTALVGTSGIVSADCAQVEQAIAATEMDTTPTNAPLPQAPPVCGSAITPTIQWSDDFENPASGRWAATGPTGWSYASQVSTQDVRYGTSGADNLYGDDAPIFADARIAMTTDVPVTAGSFLRFNHAFGFESDALRAFDGGLLEYSIDAGGTWHDAGPLISDNGYTGTIQTGFGNPLSGRAAFVGKSRGYQTSRVDLSSLAGHPVRFRFRLGTDSVGFDAGWFIDDVTVYDCPITTPSAPPIPSAAPPLAPVVPSDTIPPRLAVAPLARVTLAAPVVTWTASDDTAVSQVQVRRRTASAGGRPGAWSAPLFLAGSARRYVAPFQRGVTTCIEVSVLDAAGNRSTGPIRCAATPVDDRTLAVGRTKGWTRVASAKAYQRTVSTSHKRGATLTLSRARGRGLVLVATRGPQAGSVGVYISGKRIALLRLVAPRTSIRQLVTVNSRLLRGVPVVLKVDRPGRAGVTVDGVAVLT